MKKFYLKNKLEKGQIIPLVVVMFFVIIGMVVLIIDGGAIMSNRRIAQAAADAGALAGAQRICLGKKDAKSVAEYYATVNNGATSALVTVEGMQVTVNATVEHPSYFARIFGDPTLEASAEATAGCYGVCGEAVVPIAWNCRAPTVGGGPFDPKYGCQMQTLSWDLIGPMLDPSWNHTTSVPIDDFDGHTNYYKMTGTNLVDTSGLPPEQIYIIMNSDKICFDPPNDPLTGEVQCDLDGDGKNEIQTGGDRGWLYLTQDTGNISEWIGTHPDFLIKSHVWLSGKSGNVESVYNAMISAGYPGQVVMVPVYNEFCLNDPETEAGRLCRESAHASPPWPYFDGVDDFSETKNQSPYYHIITFAPFYVSCIDKKGNCPGFKYAQSLPKGSELKNDAVVEGYFLSDVDVSPDFAQLCSINLGNCTVSLSK